MEKFLNKKFSHSLPVRAHVEEVVVGFGAAVEAGYVHRLFCSRQAAAMGLGEGVVAMRASEEQVDDGGHWKFLSI